MKSEFQFHISPTSTPKSAPSFLDLTPFSLIFIFSTGCYSRTPNSLGPNVFLYCSPHTLPRNPISCKMKVKCVVFSDEFIGPRNSAISMHSCHVLNPDLVICWSLKPLWRDMSSSILLSCSVKLTFF